MTTSAGRPGAKTTPSPPVRVFRATRALVREQRVAGVAAVLLFITLFLPWYSETGFAPSKSGLASSGISLSAWSAFGLVQALVLFISIGVLALLFARGEGRMFRLPGGDGGMIAFLGSCAAVLVFYGMFDKPAGGGAGNVHITSGISWGIFLALFVSIWLAYTGVAMRRVQRAALEVGEDEPAPRPERRLTRRERSGGGEPPESARWVEPPRPRLGDPPPAEQREPPRSERLRRDDMTQLSLELPHDHFDE
jgi:hypothetical protein